MGQPQDNQKTALELGDVLCFSIGENSLVESRPNSLMSYVPGFMAPATSQLSQATCDVIVKRLVALETEVDGLQKSADDFAVHYNTTEQGIIRHEVTIVPERVFNHAFDSKSPDRFHKLFHLATDKPEDEYPHTENLIVEEEPKRAGGFYPTFAFIHPSLKLSKYFEIGFARSCPQNVQNAVWAYGSAVGSLVHHGYRSETYDDNHYFEHGCAVFSAFVLSTSLKLIGRHIRKCIVDMGYTIAPAPVPAPATEPSEQI